MKNQIKISITLFAVIVLSIAVKAQSAAADNSGGVSISAYVSDQVTGLPNEAKEMLKNKLSQLVTQNGISNGALGSRFIITPNINVLTKDILPGLPAMHAMNLEFTFYIGDGIAGRKFASKSIEVRAVGTNETKAYIDGIKNIKPNDPAIAAFLAEGKKKIIDYYTTNCESIVKTAQSAASSGNYEAAIAQLIGVPDACKPCYDKAMAAAEPMYKKYLDQQCSIKLTQARAAWNANQNSEGAASAGQLLASIDPSAACYNESVSLNKEISQRMKEIGNKEWDYKMKEREGNVEIEKARVNAYRDIGVAYYLSKRNVVVYNILGWW